MVFHRPGGGTVTVSRDDIRLDPPPDRYPVNGFDHIESYVSRLLAPSGGFKSVDIFTAAGDRGFELQGRNGHIDAVLTVEWRQEHEREVKVRSFFASLGVAASEDYVAGNGDIPDATRILAYPVSGSAAQLAELTKRVLQELCGISPSEPISIRYKER